MKKRYHKFIMAGTIVVLTGSLVSIHGQAVSISKEKPLAGITLSLDHYCETVIADAQEDAAQAQKEAQMYRQVRSIQHSSLLRYRM